jgi:hypothetical protein
MTPDPFDRAARYLLRSYPELLGSFLGLPPDGYEFVAWLDTRGIAWPSAGERVRDTLAHVVDPHRGGVPWALGVEFSLEPDPDMLSRQLVYLGEARLGLKPTTLPGDRFHVAGVVVNLTGRGKCGQDMHWPEAGLRTWMQPREVNMSERDAGWELDAIDVRAAPMALLPFIPLMKDGGEDDIIQRWLALAARETRPRRREELGLALLFADAAKRNRPWDDALKEWNMVESEVFNEWTRQAVQRAEVRAVTDTVLQILADRIGAPPPDLAVTLRAINDVKRLQALASTAARAATFEQFRQDAGL